MSTVELRQKAKALLDAMSGPQLRVSLKFLASIKVRKADAATLVKIVRKNSIRQSFMLEAMRELKAYRKTRKAVPWSRVKRQLGL